MSRIPRHVIARNRNAQEAEANATYYNRPIDMYIRARICACGHDEEDHCFGAQCEERDCLCKHFVERAA